MQLRKAVPDDAEAILSVYGPYIENTTITFEYDVPSVSDFKKRMENILGTYPYFVCEENGEVAGYAYGCRFSERAAYNWDMELSVYIKEGFKGKGIGEALYSAVIESGELMGIRNFCSRITYPNPASESLHKKLGFELEGVLKKSGYKLGVWKDVLYYTKHSLSDEPPEDLIPFDNLSDKAVNEILTKYEKTIK
ncbi:MAG: N-acetyltransferase family protein [Clostridiales bacterium]|nr:N-acetyltransferase family protein [Clostridiales bacterium]